MATKTDIWTPEQGKMELEYFTNSGYKKGGILKDPKFEKRFVTVYDVNGEKMLGYVLRLHEKGEMNYYLDIFRLIDNKKAGICKEWRAIRDFIRIPKESKLGKDLIELGEKGAFKD